MSFDIPLLRLYFAERGGFEPSEQLPVHRISSAARSTTPASLLSDCKYSNYFLIISFTTQKIKFNPLLCRITHFFGD